MKHSSDQQAGFTRTDLIAVIAIVAALSMLTLPLRGDVESESTSVICRTNKRQLIRALHLYTMDSRRGLLPPNGGDRNWVLGYIDFSSPDSTNTTLLTNPTTSLLANYLERSPRPFKCPADRSAVTRGGRPIPRARSVSMNNAVGTDPSGGAIPVPGFWLDGAGGHTANRTWRCFAKFSDMNRPKPSDLWMIIDEHPDSINDALFGSVGPGPQSQKRWIDWPAAYHNGGAGLGMADGSAQIHNWLAPATRITSFPGTPPTGPGALADILWLADRTSALVAGQP